MNAVIYYSNTGESYRIAKYLSDKIGYELLDIHRILDIQFENIFLVFPVHYQNIPKEIRPLIKNIKAQKAVVVATYGKKSFGNVLNDVKKYLPTKIVGGAYVPTKHAYLIDDSSFNDFEKLDPLFDKINSEKDAVFPKGRKNIFADFIPIKRHQMSVHIIRNDKCTNCGHCNEVCEHIQNGITDKKCNRCLKCVQSCPHKALEYRLSQSIKKYLEQKDKNKIFIY